MRKLIPFAQYFFTLLLFLPLALMYFKLLEKEKLWMIQTSVYFLWIGFLIYYFKSESKNFKQIRLIYLFSLIEFLCFVSQFFISFNNIMWGLTLFILVTGVHISFILVLSKLIKSVFYERSSWFIFFELFIYPVGFMTLAAEIGRDYQEKQRLF